MFVHVRCTHGGCFFEMEKDMRIVKKAPAKINLYLYLPGRREDGYHLIDTCMQALELCDEVEVEAVPKEEGGTGKISLHADAGYLMKDITKNTAYRAAALFLEMMQDNRPDIVISIKKRIPAQAGLGGGSTDGAAVLLALEEMFTDAVSKEQLREMAVKVGADVPFFLLGGTVKCEGIGEIMTEVTPLNGLPVLLLKPERGVSTVSCYRRFDEECEVTVLSEREREMLNEFLFPEDPAAPLSRVKKACRIWKNDLEAPALLEAPEIGKAFPLMKEFGAVFTAMSGSGSAVFGIFEDKGDIDRLLASANWAKLEKEKWIAIKTETAGPSSKQD